MMENVLARLFEHNNWANQKIIQTCAVLRDEQLDAEPRSVTKGNIRATLIHLVSAQAGYLLLLTVPFEQRVYPALTYADLQESARSSGEGLLALARGNQKPFAAKLRTRDGYEVEPWVVMVQIINHATEHREQICSMLSALGVTPPDLDGWGYGEATHALIPMEANS